MIYIAGLLIVLVLIFSAATGNELLSSFLKPVNPIEYVSGLKNKINQVLFPKTEKEILIDNIRSNYKILEDFFSGPAENILNSKDISAGDKESVKKAADVFNKTKDLLSNLENLEKGDKGLFKATVEKILGLDEKPTLEPTSIPPQCQLVCGE